MNITTFSPGQAGRRRAGFTITELLVSMSIGLVVVVAMMSMSLYTSRSFLALSTYTDMNQADRLALDQLSSEFRQATNVVARTTNSVAVRRPDGDVIRYTWNPQSRTVVRQLERAIVSGTTTLATNITVVSQKTILEDCDSLSFDLYKASPSTNGTMELSTTTNLLDCKALRMQWKCTRSPYPFKATTETITSGIVVMRMQLTDY